MQLFHRRRDGPSKDLGYCTVSCVTGSAGDARCDAAVTGWKCSAALPTSFEDGKTAFTSQPDGILGTCRKPCDVDGDCDDLAAAVDGGVTFTCAATAGFKTCEAVS